MPRRKYPMVEKRRIETQPVLQQTTNPLAWTTALKLAGNDHRRLERIDQSTVIVHNQPRSKS